MFVFEAGSPSVFWWEGFRQQSRRRRGCRWQGDQSQSKFFSSDPPLQTVFHFTALTFCSFVPVSPASILLFIYLFFASPQVFLLPSLWWKPYDCSQSFTDYLLFFDNCFRGFYANSCVCVCSRRILANFSPFQDSFTPPRCILCCVLGAFRFQEVRLSRRMRMRRRRRRKGLWSLSRVIRTRMYVLCMLWRPKAVQVILFSLGKACDTWCFYLIGRVFGLLVCLFSCLTQNCCRWPQNFPGAGRFDRRVWCWFCCF